MKYAAIILASGSATRMSGVDKMMTIVGGKPLVSFSIEAFLNYKKFDQICVTVNKSNEAEIKRIVKGYGSEVILVTIGGVRRQDSVKNGLDKISGTNIVAVHDGARPLITANVISEGLKIAEKYGSAIPVVSIEDTIKEITPTCEVIQTLDRAKIFRSQTPQFFDFKMLSYAHEKIREDVTDDSAMIESIGQKPKVYRGDRKNFKITVNEDILVAEAYLDDKVSND